MKPDSPSATITSISMLNSKLVLGIIALLIILVILAVAWVIKTKPQEFANDQISFSVEWNWTIKFQQQSTEAVDVFFDDSPVVSKPYIEITSTQIGAADLNKDVFIIANESLDQIDGQNGVSITDIKPTKISGVDAARMEYDQEVAGSNLKFIELEVIKNDKLIRIVLSSPADAYESAKVNFEKFLVTLQLK